MNLLITDKEQFFSEVFELTCKNGAHRKKFFALLKQYESPIVRPPTPVEWSSIVNREATALCPFCGRSLFIQIIEGANA